MKPLVYQTLNELMDQTAVRYGTRTAISFRGLSWNYQELNSITDNIAAGLLASGIKKGQHIALLSENTAYAVFAFYGIIKAGAVACMFNTSLNSHELIHLADISDIDGLIIGKEYKETCFYDEAIEINESHPFRYVFSIEKNERNLFTDFDELISLGASNIDLYTKQKAFLTHSDEGMILYTSGTTSSEPKAVVSTHFHLTNAAIQKADSQQIVSSDVICCALQLFHIFCIDVNILAALASGTHLAMPKDLHTQSIMDIIEEKKCTLLTCVPSMFRALIAREDFSNRNISSLRSGQIGGAYCSPDSFKRIEEAFHFTLLSALGQTEAMAGISIVYPQDSLETRATTVGHFVAHTEGKIVDPETGQVVQSGDPGEIMVRSPLLMKGYYKQPEITAKAIDADGWLHTGDLGFLDHQNNLHYIGRIKELINRGGEKIAPAEIETAINALSSVVCCKALGIPDAHYGEVVCACVILKRNESMTAEDIKHQLKGVIADFKIPQYILFMDHFPLNANGKVKVHELVEQVQSILSC